MHRTLNILEVEAGIYQKKNFVYFPEKALAGITIMMSKEHGCEKKGGGSKRGERPQNGINTVQYCAIFLITITNKGLAS